jgi:hypothetical protein
VGGQIRYGQLNFPARTSNVEPEPALTGKETR